MFISKLIISKRCLNFGQSLPPFFMIYDCTIYMSVPPSHFTKRNKVILKLFSNSNVELTLLAS